VKAASEQIENNFDDEILKPAAADGKYLINI
jgi:hypothetical protein